MTKPFIHVGTAQAQDFQVYPVMCEQHGCIRFRTAQEALNAAGLHAVNHGLLPDEIEITPNFTRMLENEHAMKRALERQRRLTK